MENGENILQKRIGKLKSAQDVAKYIARCIRRVERGGEGADANLNYKLVMMSSMLLKAIDAGALEERISRLERLFDERGEAQE